MALVRSALDRFPPPRKSIIGVKQRPRRGFMGARERGAVALSAPAAEGEAMASAQEAQTGLRLHLAVQTASPN
jgi:hypothetical protein